MARAVRVEKSETKAGLWPWGSPFKELAVDFPLVAWKGKKSSCHCFLPLTVPVMSLLSSCYSPGAFLMDTERVLVN